MKYYECLTEESYSISEDRNIKTLEKHSVSHILVNEKQTQMRNCHLAQMCVQDQLKCKKENVQINKGTLVQMAMFVKYQLGLRAAAAYETLNAEYKSKKIQEEGMGCPGTSWNSKRHEHITQTTL